MGLVICHNIKCTLCYRLATVCPLVMLRWSHFGTALAPGHMCRVNNLVFWNNDMTPDMARSVVRYAADGECGTEFESNSARLANPIQT